jgi:hypothetical protein
MLADPVGPGVTAAVLVVWLFLVTVCLRSGSPCPRDTLAKRKTGENSQKKQGVDILRMLELQKRILISQKPHRPCRIIDDNRM